MGFINENVRIIASPPINLKQINFARNLSTFGAGQFRIGGCMPGRGPNDDLSNGKQENDNLLSVHSLTLPSQYFHKNNNFPHRFRFRVDLLCLFWFCSNARHCIQVKREMSIWKPPIDLVAQCM